MNIETTYFTYKKIEKLTFFRSLKEENIIENCWGQNSRQIRIRFIHFDKVHSINLKKILIKSQIMLNY